MFIYPADRVRLDEGVAIAGSYLELAFLDIQYFLAGERISGEMHVDSFKKGWSKWMLELSELKMELDGRGSSGQE